MSHERLWAPWRLDYVATAKDEPDDGCFLCRYREADDDAGNLVVARSEHSIVVLNRFPYNNGHILVAPAEHKADLEALGDEELLDLQHEVRRCVAALKELMTPDGFNIGLNLGRAAGAGLPGHLHWHIVPRWNGDTNFMPVVGDTKVIPQSLEALYAILQPVLSSSEPE